jgi:hypothetical protein
MSSLYFRTLDCSHFLSWSCLDFYAVTDVSEEHIFSSPTQIMAHASTALKTKTNTNNLVLCKVRFQVLSAASMKIAVYIVMVHRVVS